MGTLVISTASIHANYFQLDLNQLTNFLALELACLARGFPPLFHSMLENAACHDTMKEPFSKYDKVRRSLRALTLKHLDSGNGQGNATVAAAAQNLSVISELLMAESSDWNLVLRRLISDYNKKSLEARISSQRALSWAMARFGENQSHRILVD